MQSRLQDIFARIAAAQKKGPGQDVRLLAVSKTQDAARVVELYQLGQRDFAENYVQELIEKAQALEQKGCTEVRWHFIGHLQTNKVKALLPHISSVHSVDSEKLARELAKRWQALGRQEPLEIFIEVNIDAEASKSGVLPTEVRALAEVIATQMRGELRLAGLMCVPSQAESQGSSGARPSFIRLRELEATCRPFTQGKLSMGMSGDFEIAIEEGATHVRVGTALFGARPPKT